MDGDIPNLLGFRDSVKLVLVKRVHTCEKDEYKYGPISYGCGQLPSGIYHDPGTQYTSVEFKEFSRQWGIQSISFSASYYQANGLAEKWKYVQIAKNMVRKAKLDGKDLQLALLVRQIWVNV